MDLHGIDLNLLVAFDALMKERSVTKAGHRIGRTQPAMSAALARLRVLFKDELFVRGARGLQPTPRALELAEPLSRALNQIGDAVAGLGRFDLTGARLKLKVAMQEHATFKLLPAMFSCVKKAAPHMTLDVLTYHSRDDAITLLDAGHCDVAVGVSPTNAPGRIFKKLVFEEPFVCIVRRGHPAIDGPLDIPTFMQLEHLLVSPEGDRFGHTDEVLATMGLQRNLVVTTSQMYPAPQLVANSDLIATLMLGVVRASGCADKLEILQPPIVLAPCPYVMAWHRRNDVHPAQRWLRQCIEEVAFEEPYKLA